MDLLLQSWPVAVSAGSLLIGGTLYAAKMFFMLQTVVLKLDAVEKNIATHKHDADGNVVIPAR